MHPGRGRRIREALRVAAAKSLAGTAQALAAASQAAAATASQLRPPPAAPRQASPSPAEPPTPTPAPADPATETPVSPEAPAGSPSAPPGPDLRELADRNARDVIAEVADLDQQTLRRLRTIEKHGKARKTVLAAIEQALDE
jgi:hypothetical protein